MPMNLDALYRAVEELDRPMLPQSDCSPASARATIPQHKVASQLGLPLAGMSR